MATSDYGNEMQEDLTAIVGYDEKLNNAIVRHSLDLKDQAIFLNPNSINVIFHDMKKFALVNPVIGKLATQVKASKRTDYQLTKKLLEQGKVEKLRLRFDALKYGVNNNADDNENKGNGGGGGKGGNDGNTERSNRREFDDNEDLSPPPHFFEPTSPHETSFLFSDGSLSPLRNKFLILHHSPQNQLLTILQDQ